MRNQIIESSGKYYPSFVFYFSLLTFSSQSPEVNSEEVAKTDYSQ